MKCEIIRDLLPLYIDGLTSKESNQEIEKHLKNCEECQKYYQEMTGGIDNFSVITNEEIEDVNLIKKIKKKNRRKDSKKGIRKIYHFKRISKQRIY